MIHPMTQYYSVSLCIVFSYSFLFIKYHLPIMKFPILSVYFVENLVIVFNHELVMTSRCTIVPSP